MQSTGQRSYDAASYLYSMSAFSFTIATVIFQYIQAFTGPLSMALNSTEYNRVAAHKDARNLVATILSQRTDEKYTY